jgi:hypothetical protein
MPTELEVAVEQARLILRASASGDCLSEGLLAMARVVVRVGKTSEKTVPQDIGAAITYQRAYDAKNNETD